MSLLRPFSVGTILMTTLLALCVRVVAAPGDFSTIFYRSGNLQIEAYLYKPAGNGPFPTVIYNHGNRTGGQERLEQPSVEIGRFLTQAGFAAFVPERRGFGKSQGLTVNEELDGPDRNERQVRRGQSEADDVLAALDYLKADPSINMKKIALMGYSLGGQVSVFAASRSDAFVALINQAGGSLSWNGNLLLQQALVNAARKLQIPSLNMVAENDATTEAVRQVREAARAGGSVAELIIYPPYTPPEPYSSNAPGHLIFRPAGLHIWEKDVIGFLGHYLHGQ